MALSSFGGVNIPHFEGADISVHWRESPHGDAYWIDLGPGMYLRMPPADLRDLIAKATAAMIAHGEAAEEAPNTTADADALQAAADAEARQWDIVTEGTPDLAEVAIEVAR